MNAPLPSVFPVDDLLVHIHPSLELLACAAAHSAAHHLRRTLTQQDRATVILASAASQVRFLDHLISEPVDWSRVIFFHMDEYLGITDSHPASFRRFLRERVEHRVHPAAFHYLAGDADQPLAECARYAGLIRAQAIDLCCLGIGENGHLAFNDPPVADFDDPYAVKVVKLDEACRQQQVGEGAFPNLEAVPQFAYTLSIPTLCAARFILGVVPEARKARAVQHALAGPIQTACPASILRRQPRAALCLDVDSAELLPRHLFSP